MSQYPAKFRGGQGKVGSRGISALYRRRLLGVDADHLARARPGVTNAYHPGSAVEGSRRPRIALCRSSAPRCQRGRNFSTASGARAVGQKRLLPVYAGEILALYLGVRIQAWSAAAEPSHWSARRLAVPNSQILRKA